MGHKAPGKSHREGISLAKLFKMFPDDATAQRWFEKARWPDGPYCPVCRSYNVQAGIKHKTMTHRCRDCEKKTFFSVKKGNGYAEFQVGIPDVGHCDLSFCNEFERCFVNEVAP